MIFPVLLYTMCEAVTHRATLRHTGDVHTLHVLPSTLNNIKCMLTKLSCMPDTPLPLHRYCAHMCTPRHIGK